MSGCFFALLAAAAGAAQAGLLARSVRRRPQPLLLFVRLGLVAGVLVVAARSGQLVAGAAGWFGGFAVAGVLAHRRLR